MATVETELEALRAKHAFARDEVERTTRTCRALETRTSTLERELADAVRAWENDRAVIVRERDEARRYAKELEGERAQLVEFAEYLQDALTAALVSLNEHCAREAKVLDAIAPASVPPPPLTPSTEQYTELEPSDADDDE